MYLLVPLHIRVRGFVLVVRLAHMWPGPRHVFWSQRPAKNPPFPPSSLPSCPQKRTDHLEVGAVDVRAGGEDGGGGEKVGGNRNGRERRK